MRKSSVLITGSLSQSKSAKKELQVSVAQCQFLDKPEEKEVVQVSSDDASAA